MQYDTKFLEQFKTDLRDLADKEFAIRSRRRQLFDKLVAECGDDRKAKHMVRIMLYHIQYEEMRKRIRNDLEFLIEDDLEDTDYDDAEGAV